ncbi:MAG: hypothetical protein V2A70_06905, partial [Candidatus Omnitrophota bacterium]
TAVPGSSPVAALKGDLIVDGKIYGDGSQLSGLPSGVSGLTNYSVPRSLADGKTLIDSGIYLDANGNVGIGTVAPTAVLNVTGKTTTDNFLALFTQKNIVPESSSIASNSGRMVSVQGAFGAYFMGRDVTTNIEFIMGTSTNGYAFSGAITAHGYRLRTGNLDRLNIVSTGEIGIGSTSPAGLLDVAGTTLLRGADGMTGLVVTSSSNVGIGTTAPRARLEIAGTGSTTGTAFQIDDSLYNSNVTVLDNGNIGIGTVLPEGKLVVMGGNIGIGSTRPMTGLDVLGKTISIHSPSSSSYRMDVAYNSIGAGGGVVGFGITWLTFQGFPLETTFRDGGDFAQTFIKVASDYRPFAAAPQTTFYAFNVAPIFNPSAVAPTVTGRWVSALVGGTFGSGDENYNTVAAPSYMTALSVEPTFNVAAASTAGYAAFFVNPTETSVSSVTNNYLALFQTSGVSKLALTSAGNLGVGTVSPLAGLQVGVGASTMGATLDQMGALIRGNLEVDGIIYGNGSQITNVAGAVSGLTNYSVPRSQADGKTLIDSGIYTDANGNVGVGTMSPTAKLSVGAAPDSVVDGVNVGGAFLSPVATGNGGNLYVYTTDSEAVDKGGVISLGGSYTGISETRWAAIAGLKENGTDGQYGGYLALYTRANGSVPAERIRITSNGSIGMGTSAPAAKLDIGVGTTGPGLMVSSDNGNAIHGDYLTVTSTGYVGIGTEAPRFGLEFYAHQTAGPKVLFGNDYSNGLAVQHNKGTGYYGILNLIAAAGDTVGALHIGMSTVGTTALDYGIILQGKPNSNWSATSPVARGYYLPGIAFAGQTNAVAGTGMTIGAALNGFVDGVVSTGVIPTSIVFRTGTSVGDLIDQMIVSSAGNIGIGTIGPRAKLEVVASGSTTGTAFQIDDNLYNPKVTVLDNGNVGIGTVLPGATMEVVGALRHTASAINNSVEHSVSVNGSEVIWQVRPVTTNTFPALRLRPNGNPGGYGSSFEFYMNDDLSNYSRLLYVGYSQGHVISSDTLGTGVAQPIKFRVGTGDWSGIPDVLTLSTSRNVGVGTTVPAAKLHVGVGNQSGTADLSSNSALIKGNLEVDGVIYGNGSQLTNLPGSISGLTTYAVPMASSATTLVDSGIYTDANGNVGIGTTEPMSPLDVKGPLTSGSTVLVLRNGDNAVGSAGETQITFGYNNTAQYPEWIRTRHNTGTLNNAIDFYTGDGTASAVFPTNAVLGMSINGGNVGIGTLFPAASLHVGLGLGTVAGAVPKALIKGNLEVDGKIYGDGSQLSGLPSGVSGLTNYSVPRALDATTLVDSGIYTDANGNVGIGTTEVVQKLEIGSVSDNGNIIQINGSNTKLNTISGQRLHINADALYLNPDRSADVVMVTGGGNVGVGTTSPAYKLAVAGNLKTTGQVAVGTYALTDGATIAVDWNNGNVQYVTLGGNRALTFSNPIAGGKYSLMLIQDATGSRTITSWPTIAWSGGIEPVLTTSINKTDIVSCLYVNSTYYCDISQNF